MRHRSTFDQQSDRVGLVLLPGGEAWIAAGECLDLGAVVRGNADTRPVAGLHGRGAGVQLPRPCRPARWRETDVPLRGSCACVLPQRQDEARPRVPDPALIWIDGAGLDRPPRRLGPKSRDRHDGLRVDAVLAQAQVGAGDRVGGPGSAHPDPELVDAVTRKLMRFGSVVFSIRNSIIGMRSKTSEVSSSVVYTATIAWSVGAAGRPPGPASQ
jgi:hypothetical protein